MRRTRRLTASPSSLSILAASLVAASLAGVLGQGCGPKFITVASPGPGAEATSFLTSATTSMVIEIAPVSSEDPDPRALALLLQRATERCNKPEGIRIVIDPDVARDPSSGETPRSWTLPQLAAFAAAHRTVPDAADQIVLFIAYVDGALVSPPNVIGTSFAPTSIAVFRDQLRATFGDEESEVEGRVLVHELGHELGLVNEGIPMVEPHEDTAHPPHCNNPDCVMFWTLHGAPQPGQPLPPDDYDANCLADLRAAGGQ